MVATDRMDIPSEVVEAGGETDRLDALSEIVDVGSEFFGWTCCRRPRSLVELAMLMAGTSCQRSVKAGGESDRMDALLDPMLVTGGAGDDGDFDCREAHVEHLFEWIVNRAGFFEVPKI